MVALELWVNRIAAALATTFGFLGIMSTILIGAAVGIPLHFSEFWSICFNMYLSLAALVIAATLLVAQRRDTSAIQAKLDHIMMSGEGDNDLVGLDSLPSAEIEKARSSTREAVRR